MAGEDRTNNLNEAANSRLHTAFKCLNPTIWNFIKTLCGEHRARDADYAKFIARKLPPQKAKRFRVADAKIMRIMLRYDRLNMEEFLSGIVSNIGMQD